MGMAVPLNLEDSGAWEWHGFVSECGESGVLGTYTPEFGDSGNLGHAWLQLPNDGVPRLAHHHSLSSAPALTSGVASAHPAVAAA